MSAPDATPFDQALETLDEMLRIGRVLERARAAAADSAADTTDLDASDDRDVMLACDDDCLGCEYCYAM